MFLSGFTFVYNAIEGGYPIVEAIAAVRPYVSEIVAVDCQSTDGTREILEKVCDWVIAGPPWEGRDASRRAYDYHRNCHGDVIIFFEADEVYSDKLLKSVTKSIKSGILYIGVHRIQIGQNFQRVREYPTPCYRIFPKGDGNYQNHPMACPEGVTILLPESGLLWDCSNCFRDNWLTRKANQSLSFGPSRHLLTARHFTEPNEVDEATELERLKEPHWEWTTTPLDIPKILRPLVGKTRYEIL